MLTWALYFTHFFTFKIERRGADIVTVWISDDPGWDFVPFPDSVRSKAQMHYGNVYNLPEVPVNSTLLSWQTSCCIVQIRQNHRTVCEKEANIILIVEMLYPAQLER